jgi:hypothetical protein
VIRNKVICELCPSYVEVSRVEPHSDAAKAAVALGWMKLERGPIGSDKSGFICDRHSAEEIRSSGKAS